VLRVKRVRNPDVGLPGASGAFPDDLPSDNGVTVSCSPGLRPELLDAFSRLGFLNWFPADRIFPQGKDEDSATLAAIRAVYHQVGAAVPEALRLYYQV
jgi:SulP family sulfate permease